MGRKENLRLIKGALSLAVKDLAAIKAADIKHRKRVKASHKPKYTADINLLSSLIGALIQAKKIIRVIPKAVQ